MKNKKTSAWNWFLPISEARSVGTDVTQTMNRIRRAMMAMEHIVRTSFAAVRHTPTADELMAERMTLAAIAPADRRQIASVARAKWVIGCLFIVFGVGIGAMWVRSESPSLSSSITAAVMTALWILVGIRICISSMAAYHGVATCEPLRGIDIVRSPALWWPGTHN